MRRGFHFFSRACCAAFSAAGSPLREAAFLGAALLRRRARSQPDRRFCVWCAAHVEGGDTTYTSLLLIPRRLGADGRAARGGSKPGPGFATVGRGPAPPSVLKGRAPRRPAAYDRQFRHRPARGDPRRAAALRFQHRALGGTCECTGASPFARLWFGARGERREDRRGGGNSSALWAMGV